MRRAQERYYMPGAMMITLSGSTVQLCIYYHIYTEETYTTQGGGKGVTVLLILVKITSDTLSGSLEEGIKVKVNSMTAIQQNF